MDLWVYLLVAGCLFGFGEIITTGFYLAPFSLACFVGAGLGALGASDVIQLAVVVVVTALTFMFVRPIVRRVTAMPEPIGTGTDALIGQRAIVMERIANDEGVGLVKIGGEVWTARTPDHNTTIAEGTAVQVLEIRGATALVGEL